MKTHYFIPILFAFVLLGQGCTLANTANAPASGSELVQNTEAPSAKDEPSLIDKLTTNTIDLSNQNLTKIPESTFSKTGTEELNISNNRITGAIQAEIRHLQNLRVLNASNNNMTGVPAEIGQLKNLEVLDLSNNQLTGLPNELGNLQNLKTLNLSGNNVSEQDLAGILEKLPADVSVIR